MNIEQWKTMQKERIFNSIIVHGPHNCWTCDLGGKGQKYSTLSVKMPWEEKKKTVLSHRFAYMIFNNNFELSENLMDVSHLCHQPHCVNPGHLSYEPHHVNMDRQVCSGIYPLRCKKHEPYKDCML